MNRLRLLQRNLLHFRGVNRAVIAGMAVATAVLTGAIMVGDSVRGSLRELTLQRLGNTDYAIISTRFFDDSLANRVLEAAPDFELAPTAILQGAASDESTGTHTADVQIAAGAWVDVDRGTCIINGELADSLGIKAPGEAIVLSLPNDNDAPRDGALDRRARGDTISDLRVEVSKIVRERGVISLFNPNGGQRPTRNAWVNLPDLQDAIDKPGGINALLAHSRSGSVDAAGLKKLNDAVTGSIALEDYGLTRTSVLSDTQVAISSRSTYIAPPIVDAGDAVAASLAVPLQKVSVNLLTSVTAKTATVKPLTPSPGTPGEGRGEGDLDFEAQSRRAGTGALGSQPRAAVPHVAGITLTPTHSSSSVSLRAEGPTTVRGSDAAKVDGARADVRVIAAPSDSVAGVADPGPASAPPATSEAPDLSQSTGRGGNETGATTNPVGVIYYAVAAGVNDLDGQPLGANDIAVNQWTADQLGVKPGDSITIDFYERGSNGELHPASASHSSSDLTFTVARVLPMDGIGADPTLPPDYKGLTDADSVANWNPPEGLKIDKALVTEADEAYWQDYRAAPKIFVSFDAARKLWGGVYGDITGLRVPADKADAFCDALQKKISPASMQMTFRAIRSEQLAAAGSGTDFGEYFFYFSFFLIVAAVLLVAMLFRLGIEQRARQLGLMSAVGFPPSTVRQLALAEGLILAVVGGAIGAICAVAYTWLIVAGLRTWWVGAVGTTAMRLYVKPLTLIIGYLSGVTVAMLAVWWGAWRIGRVPAASLLAGSWENQPDRTRRTGRVLRIIGMICVLCGLAALALAAFKRQAADEAFLAGGSLLLCGSLAWLAGSWHARPWHGRPARVVGAGQKKPPATPKVHSPIRSLLSLAIRNATRHTARSVLSVGLIAFAVFTLIVAAGMRQATSSNGDDKKSGTGGYRLILKAAIPIFGDLNTAEGRKLAGIRGPNDPIWAAAQFTPMRRWAGQDISCLNLMRPTAPTILSVPSSMVQRSAFTFAGTLTRAGPLPSVTKSTPTVPYTVNSPWTLLDSDQGHAIPVIADNDTAQYILKVPVGGELTITDQLGRSRQLQLVATISHSIFQSELLMGETNFRKLFPANGGAGLILVDCKPNDASELRKRLGAELDEYSVSVDTTEERLAAYQAVANTYLATFQMLGSLGLLLGTVGLAVVLIRTVLERKPELALLACLGFQPRDRVRLILGENAFLLLLGLAVGSVCALIGVLPAIIASGRSMNLTGLGLTLLGVLIVGLVSSSIAVALSGIHVSPADLRRE